MLAFNERVLAQCELDQTPALERLRFLTIVSSNIDEFFEVRIAELNEKLDDLEAIRAPEAPELRASLMRVAKHAHAIVERQYQILNERVLPTLRAAGIDLVRSEDLSPIQRRWIRATFLREVAPVLTPIGLDPAHPFPAVANKGLHYIVELATKRKGDRRSVAIVKVPRTLPRLMEIKPAAGATSRAFVLLSTILQCELQSMFPGRVVIGFSQFRVTRDSDLWVDEKEMTDLRHALAGQLRRRPYGTAVRLEINAECSDSIIELLRNHFKLEPHEVYRVNGPVNLARLQALVEAISSPALCFPEFIPGEADPAFVEGKVFAQLKKQDVLLHHPYQSFEPVVQMLREAVADPNVIAIKQTIYRTGSKSVLMDLLIDAVRRGKEVTVVLELKARFDEETNINWAEKLEQAGAHVVYGVVGLKTHAKLLLILRREGNSITHYAHLASGNYNPSTARAYTDFGVLTANQVLGREVASVFHYMTSMAQPPRLKHLWWSPHTMKTNIIEAINNEALAARAGKPAKIMAKINALTDEVVIAALYAAAQAGVRIDLIVRGACCIGAQLPGFSENIHVRSIIGRFLEHSRIYYFENGGDPRVYISSADWMSRNLDRRVEVAVPLLDPLLRDRVVDEGLRSALVDNQQAWRLQRNGAYRLLRPLRGQLPHSTQESLAKKWGHLADVNAP